MAGLILKVNELSRAQRNQLLDLANQPEPERNYHFPTDSEPNGIPFGSKSVGKWKVQYDFSRPKE